MIDKRAIIEILRLLKEPVVEDIREKLELLRDVRHALRRISPREEKIIRSLYGIGMPQLPPRDIMAMHHLPRHRFHSIYRRAMKRLRNLLTRMGY